MFIECIRQRCRYSRPLPAVSVILCTCLMIFVIHRFPLSSILSLESKIYIWREERPFVNFVTKTDFLHMLTDFRWVPFFCPLKAKTHIWREKQPNVNFCNKDCEERFLRRGWCARSEFIFHRSSAEQSFSKITGVSVRQGVGTTFGRSGQWLKKWRNVVITGLSVDQVFRVLQAFLLIRWRRSDISAGLRQR